MRFKFLFILVFALLLVNVASAELFTFENWKEYNSVTREVVIKDLTGDIAKARLNTPLDNKVSLGYQKVAEFDLWAYEDYNDIIKSIEFYNKSVENWENNKFSRDFDIKKKVITQVETLDYGNVINGYLANGSAIYEYQVIGSHIENIITWEKLTPADLKKDGFVTIGIFTDVKKGDFVEWIPKIAGVNIDEWASWTESINTNIISYYAFEEEDTTGTGVIADELNNNNGTNSGADNTTGKVNYGYDYQASSTEYIYIPDDNTLDLSGNFTINAWIKFNALPSIDRGFISKEVVGASGYMFYYATAGDDKINFFAYGLTDTNVLSTTTPLVDTWYMITATYDGSNLKLYINGQLEDNDASTGTLTANTKQLWLGRYNHDTNYYVDAVIDEVGIWSRALTLTEINETLYNEGNANTYTNVFGSDAPIITFNSPAEQNYTTRPSIITFNFTASDDVNLTSVKLYVNGALNQTNASGLNATDYLFNVSLNDGTYDIYGLAQDNSSQQTATATRTYIVDATAPVINITSPYGDYGHILNNRTLNLNWNVTDIRLSYCWYSYNSTINYVTCGDNTTTFNYITGIDNITFFANDTLGNEANQTAYINYSYFIKNYSYDPLIYETGLNTISINVTYDISSYGSTAILEYDGTNYTTTKQNYATGSLFSKTLNAPIITDGNLTKLKQFRFYLNSTTGITATTELENQTLGAIFFGQCGGNYTTRGVNFTYYDEYTGSKINATANPTTFMGSFNYWVGTGSTYKNYSLSALDITNNSYGFCISPNGSTNDTIKADLDLIYSATGYTEKTYYLRNATLTYNTNNITLYLLNSSDAIKFYLTSYYGIAPLTDATILITKYFEGDGAYKSVGIGLTDDSGKFSFYLDEDKKYKFTAVKDGETLGIVSKSAICSATPCELTLQYEELGSGLQSGYFDEYAQNVQATLTYNYTTKLVETDFIDITGTANYFRLSVIKEYNNNSILSVCDQILYVTGGSMTCNMTGQSGDFKATLTISRSPEKIVDFIKFVVGSLAENLGFVGLVVSFIIFLVIVFAGIRNPTIFIALIPVALVVLKLIGLLPLSWLLIATITGLAILLMGRLKT